MQQEATNTLISELAKDNYNSMSTADISVDAVYSSCDNSSATGDTKSYPITSTNSSTTAHSQKSNGIYNN